jgi:nitrile hydratase subunit beta
LTAHSIGPSAAIDCDTCFFDQEQTLKLQHRLGGIENLGPVNLDTRVFAEPWEKRIFGIHTVMMAESAHLSDALHAYPVKELPTRFKHDWTWASLRTGAEDMHPFEYFKFRYYEKWLGGISQFFVDEGYITAQELEEKIAFYRSNPGAELPERPNPALGKQIDAYLQQGDSGYHALERAARCSAGETVRIADPDDVDHTRLPGYLRKQDRQGGPRLSGRVLVLRLDGPRRHRRADARLPDCLRCG